MTNIAYHLGRSNKLGLALSTLNKSKELIALLSGYLESPDRNISDLELLIAYIANPEGQSTRIDDEDLIRFIETIRSDEDLVLVLELFFNYGTLLNQDILTDANINEDRRNKIEGYFIVL